MRHHQLRAATIIDLCTAVCTALVIALGVAVLGSLAACSKVPGAGTVPTSTSSLPGAGAVGGLSGEVDPNTCGNYAASDAGRRLKEFLQAVKDLKTTTEETAKVVKQSCIMMGQELGMSDADLQGETNDICNRVTTTYQNNLKVSLKANAKLAIKYTPAVCTVDASLQARAGAECEGSASAGSGGGGAAGQCKAAAAAKASLAMQCTEPQLTITADARIALDKSRLDMTLKALRDGLPKLLSIKARLAPMNAAIDQVAATAAALKDMGPKFVQSFADQATCITGQVAAAATAATHIRADFQVSVTVTASASATAGG